MAIYIIALHPNEETLACGGLIAARVISGTSVKIVFLTSGEKPHRQYDNSTVNQLCEIREKEAVRAATILGVAEQNLTFMRFPDTRLSENKEEIIDALEAVLNEESEEITQVYFPHIYDKNEDHKVANNIVLSSLSRTDYSGEILTYIISGADDDLHRSEIIEFNIRSVLDSKNRAIAQYTSLIGPEQTEKKESVLTQKFLTSYGTEIEIFYRLSREIISYRPETPSRKNLARALNKETFQHLYNIKKWGSGETYSGSGSKLRNTRKIREMLQSVLDSNLSDKPLIITDLGCGDLNWIKEIDFGNNVYIGIDIVPDIIFDNLRRFSHRAFSFQVADITHDPIPKSDYIICKDVFTHLTAEDCVAVIRALAESGSRYLIAYSDPSLSENLPGVVGGWMGRNLSAAPFSFPEPIESLSEKKGGKIFALWDIDVLRGQEKLNELQNYRDLQSRRYQNYSVLAGRAQFETLASRNDVPGLKDIHVCKFLITNMKTAAPKLYFMDTKKYLHHYQFYKRELGYSIRAKDFDSISYYSNETKEVLSGSIVAHDSFVDLDGRRGLYALEFWPTDPISFDFVNLCWNLITRGLPFAEDRIAYHLSSETQLASYKAEKSKYDVSDIKTIDTDTLFGGLSYIPLNLAESYGFLRIMNESDLPSNDDIVVYRTLPNDLSHVRGVITDVPQTPLSHVNLKAKQNGIPNAYIKNASTSDVLTELEGKPVFLRVTASAYEIKEVSAADIYQSLESRRPEKTTIPTIDIEQRNIVQLSQIGSRDADMAGAKAANIGELSSFLDKAYCLDGHVIPFSYYDTFVKHNKLDRELKRCISNLKLEKNNADRDRILASFRNSIIEAPLPDWMEKDFVAMQAQYSGNTDLRLRSSSNSEDLPNFSGAGLYDSEIFHADSDCLSTQIKTVWGSLWAYRAFEEREFHRISHAHVAMAVLVHRDHKNEQFNGVAVTRNLFNDLFTGVYINVQSGVSLVTSPELDSTPDEFVVSTVGKNKDYEIQYIRHSNRTPDGQSVMPQEKIMELVEKMRILHKHFEKVYGAERDSKFAMELEFLATAEGGLKIMQARPWSESSG